MTVIHLKDILSDKPSAMMKYFVRKDKNKCKTTAYRCASGQPQYEATKAYMPKEPDELGLQQAELVIVFQKEEGKMASLRCASFFFLCLFFNGNINQTAYTDKNALCLHVILLAWCYGERMRDGERGWFPASCATEITNPTAMESNVQRMKRLRKETNV